MHGGRDLDPQRPREQRDRHDDGEGLDDDGDEEARRQDPRPPREEEQGAREAAERPAPRAPAQPDHGGDEERQEPGGGERGRDHEAADVALQQGARERQRHQDQEDHGDQADQPVGEDARIGVAAGPDMPPRELGAHHVAARHGREPQVHEHADEVEPEERREAGGPRHHLAQRQAPPEAGQDLAHPEQRQHGDEGRRADAGEEPDRAPEIDGAGQHGDDGEERQEPDRARDRPPQPRDHRPPSSGAIARDQPVSPVGTRGPAPG